MEFYNPNPAARHFFLRSRIRRAPEIPGGGGAVRPPAFAEREQFLHLGQIALFVGERKPVRTPKSSAGKTSGRPSWKINSISTVQRPTPRTSVKPRNDFVVGQLHDLPRSRDDAGQGFGRDVADGFDFGKRKSAGADLSVRDAGQIFRAREFPVGKQFFETREDGVGRRAVELLVRHRLHQRLKRRAAVSGSSSHGPCSRMSRRITGSRAARYLQAAVFIFQPKPSPCPSPVRREREQPLPTIKILEGHGAAVSRGFAKRRKIIPPLRSIGWRGEGRGKVRFSANPIMQAI